MMWALQLVVKYNRC